MPHKPSQRDMRSKRRQRNNENQVTKPAQRRSGRVGRIPERLEAYLLSDEQEKKALNAPAITDALDAPDTLDAPDDSETTTPIVSDLSDGIDPFACIERTESMEEFAERIAGDINAADIVAMLVAAMAEVGSCNTASVEQVAEELQRLCESNLQRK